MLTDRRTRLPHYVFILSDVWKDIVRTEPADSHFIIPSLILILILLLCCKTERKKLPGLLLIIQQKQYEN
jgi:hypothetical protein